MAYRVSLTFEIRRKKRGASDSRPTLLFLYSPLSLIIPPIGLNYFKMVQQWSESAYVLITRAYF